MQTNFGNFKDTFAMARQNAQPVQDKLKILNQVAKVYQRNCACCNFAYLFCELPILVHFLFCKICCGQGFFCILLFTTCEIETNHACTCAERRNTCAETKSTC